MKWTNQEIDLGTKMLLSGCTHAEIGITLKRTKKSVKEKFNKLGVDSKQGKINRYYEVVLCITCLTPIQGLKSDNRRFCNSICAATYNNAKYIKKKRTGSEYYGNCQRCDNKKRANKNKFCSHKCYRIAERENITNRIESGDLTFPAPQYKRYLIDKYGDKCMICGWCEVNPISGKIPIELEHIDGNSGNHNLNNLKLLCPNHHSLTPTYKALNAGNGRHKRKVRYQEGKSF